MTILKIKAAMLEAERFKAKAQAVLDEHAATYKLVNGDIAPTWTDPYGTAKTGALRRASLDLTRSLAEMRRP